VKSAPFLSSPSVAYQNLANPNKFMNVAMWEHVLLTLRFIDVSKFTTLIPLLLLISRKLSFLVVGLKSLHFILWHRNLLTLRVVFKVFIDFLAEAVLHIINFILGTEQ
jgi:hypothetical protein